MQKVTPENLYAIAECNVDLAEELYRQQGEDDPLVAAACYFALLLEIARQRLADRDQDEHPRNYSAALNTIEEAIQFAGEQYNQVAKVSPEFEARG